MSDRNGVPVSASRRVAGSNASRTASPQLSASPAWCTSSRMTRVRNRSVRTRNASGLAATPAYVTATPTKSLLVLPWVGRVRRVDRDPGPGGRLRPLGLEVLGRRDDGDPVDQPPLQQLRGDRQRERRLARPRRRHGEEVAARLAEVGVERLAAATAAASAPYPRPPDPDRQGSAGRQSSRGPFEGARRAGRRTRLRGRRCARRRTRPAGCEDRLSVLATLDRDDPQPVRRRRHHRAAASRAGAAGPAAARCARPRQSRRAPRSPRPPTSAYAAGCSPARSPPRHPT